MSGYVDLLLRIPELGRVFADNIVRTRKSYLADSDNRESLKIVVCGWELAHNAAGRAHTLAQIYQEFADDVEIVGSIIPKWGMEIWEPIRDSSIPISSFVADPNRFIEQAMVMVAAHPADVVHLSKPRAPNIFFGILYKLLWGARVILDIDDEELAFVKAEEPIALDDFLLNHSQLPPLSQISGKYWTQIAVGLANEFDGITVSNSALQNKYGGVIIAHARDRKLFQKDLELRSNSRSALGIRNDQKVVLFSGTPRPHKGLLEVARAIKSLKRDDILFVIAGSFSASDQQFKRNLQSIQGVNYLFIENQPVDKLSQTLSIADCCVLLQDTNHTSSQFQMPAKLSDALAMSIPTIVSKTKALGHIIEAGAVVAASDENLPTLIAKTLDNLSAKTVYIANNYFDENLSLLVNANRLKNIFDSTRGGVVFSTSFHKIINNKLFTAVLKRKFSQLLAPSFLTRY